VRGCSERLQSEATRASIAVLEEERDAKIAYIDARGYSKSRRSKLVAKATDERDEGIKLLLPAPVQVGNRHWKRLVFYPELVRDEQDAEAFVDEQATREEFALAIDAGAHSMCARYPAMSCAKEPLLVAWVAYLVQCDRICGEDYHAMRERLKEKVVAGAALVRYLGRNKEVAAQFPVAAIEAAARGLGCTGADQRGAVTALRLLATLPSKLVMPHAAALDRRVAAETDVKTLRILEALVKHVYDPSGIDMKAEHAMAMCGG
jgi:hypothetical protein